MSDQRYMDGNGLPLSPDLRTRDRQIWQAEHLAETPEWAPYPEDEYPVYVDDLSVEGAD